jgi:hypothetical protein
MDAILNPSFLRQTRFDSASPAGAAVVVPRFDAEGEFDLAVARGDEMLRRVRVNVGGPSKGGVRGGGGGADDGPGGHRAPEGHASPGGREDPGAGRDPLAPEPPSADRPDAPALGAVALDVAKLLLGGTERPEVGDLPSGGYLSITSSQPIPDHHLLVRAGDDGEDVLDTRRLGPRSMFAVTLVRPGRYALRNAITGAEATVVVTYPRVGDTPYRPPDPLEIQSGEQGFGASTFTISPAQGIVFRFAVESRIQLDLVEPDDGPSGGDKPPVVSFRRPRPPDGGAA